MITLKRATSIFVLLFLSICLYAAGGLDDTPTSIPPGIKHADWHVITDDLGFVLRISKEPIGSAILLEEYQPTPIPDDAPADVKSRLEQENEFRQELHEERASKLKPKDQVGRGQILLFARNGDTWYVVTTPPPSFGVNMIQK